MTARANQSFPERRGVCPGLSRPLPTGDGLLVRLMPTGTIALDAFAALCAAAQRHGNGIIEITARGKSAGCRAGLTFGAAVSVRGCGKIGSADVVAAGIAAQQFLGTRAVGTRRRAEDAVKAKHVLVVASAIATRGGERIILLILFSRCDRLYRGVNQCELRRK